MTGQTGPTDGAGRFCLKRQPAPRAILDRAVDHAAIEQDRFFTAGTRRLGRSDQPFRPGHLVRGRHARVTSVKLVEVRGRREVAIGQAARGGIWMGSPVSERRLSG